MSSASAASSQGPGKQVLQTASSQQKPGVGSTKSPGDWIRDQEITARLPEHPTAPSDFVQDLSEGNEGSGMDAVSAALGDILQGFKTHPDAINAELETYQKDIMQLGDELASRASPSRCREWRSSRFREDFSGGDESGSQRGRAQHTDDESHERTDTAKPPDRKVGDKINPPESLPSRKFVIAEPTQTFGRGADGDPVGPTINPPTKWDVREERLVRLKECVSWNAFCRFLNDVRRTERSWDCEQPGTSAIDEVMPEDYLYFALQHIEDSPEYEGYLKMIEDDAMDALEVRADAFNANSRRDWARQICQGEIKIRPKVYTGVFGIEYIVFCEEEIKDHAESKLILSPSVA